MSPFALHPGSPGIWVLRGKRWRSAIAALLVSSSVQATTYSIVTLGDGVVNDGDCTLREALMAAEADLEVDLCPAGGTSDEIVLSLSGTYSFGLGQQALTGAASLVSIRGANAAQWQSYIVDLEGANRFLTVDSGAQVSLRDLVIRNGDVRGNPQNSEGGALFVGEASMTLEHLRIEASKAHSGGGLAFIGFLPGALVLRDVSFSGNEAEAEAAFDLAEGGGLCVVRFDADSSVTFSDVTFENNLARAEITDSNAYGAGLFFWLRNAGRGDLQRLHFSGNQLRGGGGGGLGGAALAAWLDDYDANAVYPNLRLRDVAVDSNTLVGASETIYGLAIDLQVLLGSSAWLDRITLRGDGAAISAPHLRVLSQSGNTTLANVLAVDGPSRGVEVDQEGGGSVLLGHMTSSGHATDEVALSNTGPGTVRLENSIVWGDGVADLILNGTVDIAAENLFGIDPQFVNPGANDFELASTSPAVDAGDATLVSVGALDARHRPRVAGLEADLGALERGSVFGDGFDSGDTGAWSQSHL